MAISQQQVHPRFTVTAQVEVRDAKGQAGVRAKFRNVSLSGCFLETEMPLPENTRVRVLMKALNLHADVWGIVRRCEPAVGMGVQFTNGNTVEDWKRLEQLIEKLETRNGQKTCF
jgi:hypothetical protein